MNLRGTAPIPAQLNLALGGVIAAANLFVLLLMPFALNGLWNFLAAAIVILSTPAHWALVHDAIHGQLLPSRVANAAFGRLLAIAFGVPFRAVRFAHLRHHRYSRAACAREEVYDPAQHSRLSASGLHYLRITIGLYMGELALCLLCLLPRATLRRLLHALCARDAEGGTGMRDLADREILAAAALAEIRIDACCIIAMLATAFIVCSATWWLPLCVLCGRAFVISQLDHAPHHGTPIDQRDFALNMRAPRWLELGLLNFNIHRTHHLQPNLPWQALAQARDTRVEDISLWRAVLRQWRGPIALGDVPRASSLRPDC